MWFVFGLVTLLAAGVVAFWRRREDRWRGEAQPGGWRQQVARNQRTKAILSVTIGVDSDCPIDFQCKPERGFDRLCKRLGLAKELQAGDAAFDADVYLVCDDERLRTRLRDDRELVANLHALVVGGGPHFVLHALVCRSGQLRASWNGRGRSSDADPLIEGAVPLLQAVQAALPRAGAVPATGRDRLFLRSVAVLAVSTALAINGLLQLLRLAFNDDTIIVDRGELWAYGLATSLALWLLLLAMSVLLLGGTSRLQLVLAEVLVVGTFGCLASGVNLVRDVNATLDFGPVDTQRGTVGYRERRETRGSRGRRSTSYYVTYHGVDLPDDGEIRVSRGQYERMRTAMPVFVHYHAGALGIRWVSGIDPAPYEFDLKP